LLDGCQNKHQSPEQLSQLLAAPNQNSAKLYLSWKALNVRKQHAALFQHGEYVPLTATGQGSNHLIAFARRHEGQTAIVAVPRLCAKLMGDTHQTTCGQAVWADAALEIPNSPATCYHNVLTGECIPVGGSDTQQLPLARLFRHFPVALLLSVSSTPQPSTCQQSEQTILEPR
jgi:(1->4)-alpha-D-glucan 1-alpha-D-glucosylmutase